MNRFALTFIALASFGCSLDSIEVFPDEYVSDQFGVFGIGEDYALGAEVRFSLQMREGETRVPELEITGPGLRIDETDAEGVVHATAVAVGTGEVIYRLDGDEIRRHTYEVRAIEHIAVEHIGLDSLEGFVIENGVFDPSLYSIAVGASYGLDIRYEDADGNVLNGSGLLSAEGGIIEELTSADAIVFPSTTPGDFSIVLSAGDATTTITYTVVDEIASLVLNVDSTQDDVISIHPRATDAEGRRVYGKPTWRIDGEEYYPAQIAPGIVFDPGFVAFEPGGESHRVEATLLGTTGSTDAVFLYPAE